MKLSFEYKFDMNLITDRSRYFASGRAHHHRGGALNANYTQVDAIARIAEICCRQGLVYGKDWYWETCQTENIFLSFSEEKYATMVTLALDKGYVE